LLIVDIELDIDNDSDLIVEENRIGFFEDLMMADQVLSNDTTKDN